MRSCIWPVRHSAATSISGGSARAIAERAARTQSAGACSAPPPGRWRVGYSALVLTIVRPPRSISAAFAEVVPRSRQSRPIMTAGYARVVSERAGDDDRPKTESRPTTDSRPTTRDRRAPPAPASVLLVHKALFRLHPHRADGPRIASHLPPVPWRDPHRRRAPR